MSKEFYNIPSHMDLADHDEVRSLLAHWTDKGAMWFKWPADDNWEYHEAGSRWLRTANRAELPEGEKYMKYLDERNGGAAFKAFLEYWYSVPARNAQDLHDSSWALNFPTWDIGHHLANYKKLALQNLLTLKKSLDEHNDWVIQTWPWSLLDADKKARALVSIFDERMKAALSIFNDLKSAALKDIRKEKAILEEISRLRTENLKLGS